MGLGAPNTGWCNASYPWDCHLPPLPSGPDPGHPTRILGAGWDQGCQNPPELWGAERPWQIISLNNTSNAMIGCLEITDHSGCVEFHANAVVECDRSTPPFGDWASTGMYAQDSSNVLLKDLNIHGLAASGIRAGRIFDWTVEDVRIAGNGWVGWEGDLGAASSSNSGTLNFRRWMVEWNGCAETYPGEQPEHCWAQPVGGYGDGVGTAATGGHWIIEDSIFRYNTSDGLDLLYVTGPGTQIEISRTTSYGNAGDQIKVAGSTKIENALSVSNCGFFDNKPFAPSIAGMDPIDHCRAGGSALALNLRQGNTISVVNSTIVGQGDCLGIVECHSGGPICNGTETVIVQNNVFRGYGDFHQAWDDTCYFWFDQDNFYDVQMDYNIIYDTKTGSYPPFGSNDVLADPLFTNANLETFDGHLQTLSPGINSGLAVGSLSGLIPAHDLENASRPFGNGVDRGAYENSILDELVADFGISGLWHYDQGSWNLISTGNASGLEMLNGDLAADFDVYGFYLYDGTWSRISNGNSEDMVAKGSDLFVDFGTNGLWEYSNATWTRISTGNPEGVASYTTKLVADFGTSGLFTYDNTWFRLSSGNAQEMLVCGSELFVDFGIYGLWEYGNTAWTRISTGDPEDLECYSNHLMADFGIYGLYEYDNTWSRISSGNAENLIGAGSDLYVDFGSLGLWEYAGTWARISTGDSEGLKTYGNKLVADFGTYGLYEYDGAWTRISTGDCENMKPVNIN
jgi:hypothetical protein